MNLQDYATNKRKKTPGVDAVERWNSRVLPLGLHLLGRQGGIQYLNMYGKTMGAPKAIAMACQADEMGCHEMAVVFWQRAAQLENVAISDVGNVAPDSAPPMTSAHSAAMVEWFPKNCQPGSIVTMQPSDAAGNRDYYVNSPNYWGQRKRDGNKYVVFATPDEVFYQSRSTKLKGAWDIDAHNALMQAAQRGAFILEGELYYLDYNGGEHRTGAQAASVNIEAGVGTVTPRGVFMPFFALYTNHRDLRDDTYAVRILFGNAIARNLTELAPGKFEQAETFRTTLEKRALVHSQQAEGREGEIWFDPNMTYTPGKQRSDRIVRTKYLETNEYIVTGFTDTTGAGRLFGAMEIKDLQGKPVGSVGTGFDRETQAELLRRHELAPGNLKVMVTHQGTTEYGQVFHARFEDYA